MRIYLAPWGNPREWREVEYRYGGKVAKGSSTLSLLKDLDDLKPDLTIIFVPDTLAANLEISSVNYFDLVSRVEEEIKKYIRERVGLEKDVFVKVLPGVLGYREGLKYRFKARMFDLTTLTVYHTYEIIVEKLGGLTEGFEAIIDTTHGINYFTVMVRDSVFEAIALSSVALSKPVSIRMFNSDPFPRLNTGASSPDKTKGVILDYNLLMSTCVYPWDITRFLDYDYNQSSKVVSDYTGCSLDSRDVSELLNRAKHIVTSFRTGAFLELINIVAETLDSGSDWGSSVMKVLKNAYECWLNKVCFQEKDKTGVLWVEFRNKLMDGFKLLLHAHAIYMGVKRTLPHLEKRINMDGVSLSDLRKLVDETLKGSMIVNTLVNNELDTMWSRTEGMKIGGDWVPYADIYRSNSDELKINCSEFQNLELRNFRVKVDKEINVNKLIRNFVAHAGLLKDITEVKIIEKPVEKHERESGGAGSGVGKGREIYVRIKPDCWSFIKSTLDLVFENITRKK